LAEFSIFLISLRSPPSSKASGARGGELRKASDGDCISFIEVARGRARAPSAPHRIMPDSESRVSGSPTPSASFRSSRVRSPNPIHPLPKLAHSHLDASVWVGARRARPTKRFLSAHGGARTSGPRLLG
jgi:hypothetical protein